MFDEIDTFKNGPGGDLTGNQVRDKLTDIALKVLEENKRLGSGPKSKAFGEFRSRLSPDPNGNGGNEGTEGFKHNSELVEPAYQSRAEYYSQDWSTEWYSCHCELQIKMEEVKLISSLPCSLTVSKRTQSAHPGAKKNGRSSCREYTGVFLASS